MSIPTLEEFNPKVIPFQFRVIKDIRLYFDYSVGVHEILLSGSVGSAKSILMAHLAVTHCVLYPGACALIGRLSMPSLKDTLLQMIVDHLGIEIAYEFNQTRGKITFPNGSTIICHSWSDKKYKKVRSYALSAAFIEELTENDDPEFYKEIRMRLNRIPSVPEKILVCATNPDAPSHWAYEYFIENAGPTRHVYYSVTSDNPFLDVTYISQLKETLSPKEAQRMLYGEWVELLTDVIYYNYSKERNYSDQEYVIDYNYPIDIMFDFNIGEGKPMSCAVGQVIGDRFNIFDEVIVDGARTGDIMDELVARHWYQKAVHIRVYGDASGKNRDTRSIKSDYDIIKDTISNTFCGTFEMMVPLANPPVRKRHNLVNATFYTANYTVRFMVYKCKTVDKGLRLTKLKKGGNYIEDDSDRWQHVTTAIGYWICKVESSRLSVSRVRVRKMV